VDFGFGEGATDAKDHAFSVIASDADGFEGGAVADDAVDADFVILKRKMGVFVELALSEVFDFGFVWC
jgi:hypothetical protein